MFRKHGQKIARPVARKVYAVVLFCESIDFSFKSHYLSHTHTLIQVPGFREFVANSPQLSDNNREVPDWMKGLEKEDMDLLWNLGKLNSTQIYEKIKSLYNLSVELGVEEEREMVRGRFLDVLGPKDDSSDETK